MESAYEECLCYELDSREINFERQLSLPVLYKEKQLDCGYRIDVLIEKSIILELKAIDKIEAIHKAQLLTYLKLSNIRLGLILNFNVPIMKNGIVRIVNEFSG